MRDVVIIGAGVIGAMVAKDLAKYDLKITVLEKENDVCNVTSMANSAIVHSGYDPEPETFKGKLNKKGNEMFEELCKKLDVELKMIGSLTLATNEEEEKVLDELLERSKENGVETSLLSREELLKIEPFISDIVTKGLIAPTCGIVNPFELTVALMENAIDNGVELHLNEEVVGIEKVDGVFNIKTKNGNVYQSKIVVNAAGLKSDYIASLVGDTSFTVKARKGEYFVLDHFKQPFVTHTIFPTPTKAGKGILVTPTTHGNYLLGPTSDFVDDKDCFATTKESLDAIRAKASTLVKNIPFHETIRSFTGLRAVSSTGDFVIKESDVCSDFYILGGIQSPGLASSPAISEYLINIIKEKHQFNVNEKYCDTRRPLIKLDRLSGEERAEMIKKDPRFGTMICRCEKVSEGEIVDVIHRSCGAKTIKGVKKRIRPGFGKCQGGFCEALVLNILARELNIDPMEVVYDSTDSQILKYKTKEGAGE